MENVCICGVGKIFSVHRFSPLFTQFVSSVRKVVTLAEGESTRKIFSWRNVNKRKMWREKHVALARAARKVCKQRAAHLYAAANDS